MRSGGREPSRQCAVRDVGTGQDAVSAGERNDQRAALVIGLRDYIHNRGGCMAFIIADLGMYGKCMRHQCIVNWSLSEL